MWTLYTTRGLVVGVILPGTTAAILQVVVQGFVPEAPAL